MKEEWRDIPGYEGLYKVSNLGRVISCRYRKTNKESLLKPWNDKYGYKILCLKGKKRPIHRLVLMSFSYNIYNKPQINHINGIKEDNRLENLEWATASENLKHAYETGLRVGPWVGKFGKDNHSSKKIIQLTTNGEFIKEWESMSLVVRELGIIQSNISSCCCGRRQTAGGFKWKFKK